MNEIFNMNNPVFVFLGKLGDLCVISILWLLCSLPIITLLPSSAALYYTVVKSIRRDRGNATREFWKAFKNNLKQGIIINIIVLLFSVVVVMWYRFSGMYDVTTAEGMIFTIISRVLLLLEVFGLVFMIPIFSRFGLKISEYWKICYYVSARHFLTTILTLVLLILAVFFIYAVPPLIIIVPGGLAWISSYWIEPVLVKYTKEISNDKRDEWFIHD